MAESERGLAGAVRADDADDLARADSKVDAAHRGHRTVAHDEAGHLRSGRGAVIAALSGAEIGAAHSGIGADFAGVPAAIVLPLSSTWMRSHKFITSAMLCSITRTPQPYAARTSKMSCAQFFGFGRRQPGGRLVEQEKARIDCERAGKPDSALLAIAQCGGGRCALSVESSSPRMSLRAPPRLVAAEALRHLASRRSR